MAEQNKTNEEVREALNNQIYIETSNKIDSLKKDVLSYQAQLADILHDSIHKAIAAEVLSAGPGKRTPKKIAKDASKIIAQSFGKLIEEKYKVYDYIVKTDKLDEHEKRWLTDTNETKEKDLEKINTLLSQKLSILIGEISKEIVFSERFSVFYQNLDKDARNMITKDLKDISPLISSIMEIENDEPKQS